MVECFRIHFNVLPRCVLNVTWVKQVLSDMGDRNALHLPVLYRVWHYRKYDNIGVVITNRVFLLFSLSSTWATLSYVLALHNIEMEFCLHHRAYAHLVLIPYHPT